MVKSFDVTYDDFSGGHFVGRVDAKQPMNTFVGANVGTDPADGSLVPLAREFLLTTAGGLGDAANLSTRPLIIRAIATNKTLVCWATQGAGGHFYQVEIDSTAPPFALHTAALAVDAMASSTPCYFPPTNRVIVLGSAGTTAYSVDIGLATPVATAIAGFPVTGNGIFQLVAWGEFLVGNDGAGGYYFSDPSTHATWSGVSVSGPICLNHLDAMVVHQGNLWIAADTGWWVMSGIPNSTLTLRQVTTIATGRFPVSIDSSLVTGTPPVTGLLNTLFVPNGPLITELSGLAQRGLNFAVGPGGSTPTVLRQLVRVGQYIVGTQAIGGNVTDEGGEVISRPTHIWYMNINTGVWTRRTVPELADLRVATWPDPAGDLLCYRTSSGGDNLVFARLSVPGLIPDDYDGTWSTGTAELAEYFHRQPFQVGEVICEVDYGYETRNPVAADQERVISVSVQTTGALIEHGTDLSAARSTTSLMTQILPSHSSTGANYTTRRSWVRFNLNDGADTFTATPVVTLTGLKLRRLIMRCREVG